MQKTHLLNYTTTEQFDHGMKVAALAYQVGQQLQLSEETCGDLILAGIMHDVGKISLQSEMEANQSMIVEEMGYIRQHPQRGYKIMKDRGFREEACEMVLYHHENWDGSGYPYNQEGRNIPLGACILRVCDVFCALTDNRSYRDAYTIDRALELMIREIKNFDVRVFMALQQLLHDDEDGRLRIPECPIDLRGEFRKYGIEEKTGYWYEGHSAPGDGDS
ncbi:MAG: HD domain-containing protein [Lachnospiraceae bacterium]|nr:HD domain-containing protein [Lachnospiraceae bacterium]